MPGSCPTCEGPIEGVRTNAPGRHVIDPCGHPAPLGVRQAAMVDVRTDGGETLACEECDRADRLAVRSGRDGGERGWYCGWCRLLVDVTRREDRSRKGRAHRNSPLVARLEDMDPDELGELVTDGGDELTIDETIESVDDVNDLVFVELCELLGNVGGYTPGSSELQEPVHLEGEIAVKPERGGRDDLRADGGEVKGREDRDEDYRLRESIKQGRLYQTETDLSRNEWADLDAALDILESIANRRDVELPPGVGE